MVIGEGTCLLLGARVVFRNSLGNDCVAASPPLDDTWDRSFPTRSHTPPFSICIGALRLPTTPAVSVHRLDFADMLFQQRRPRVWAGRKKDATGTLTPARRDRLFTLDMLTGTSYTDTGAAAIP
jgi:hypothetical protein